MSYLTIILIVLGGILLVSLIFRKEIKSCLEKDPAAVNFLEVVLTYSGLHAIIFYRIAGLLHRIKIPFLPRLISQLAKFLTGIEIHPGAIIGNGLFIDHGMGVVIGETSIIGDNVILYQGVTLGGTGKEKGKRHPTLGNNIVVGTGAKILGDITIGDSSYIGANAVVIKDVPANSTVVGVPGRITKQDGKKLDKALDHIHVFDPILQDLEQLKARMNRIEEGK